MKLTLADSKPSTFLLIRDGKYVHTDTPTALELTRLANEQGRVLAAFPADQLTSPRFHFHERRAHALASMAMEVA